MIPLTLEEVAEIVGGRLEGDGAGVVVGGPVVIDGREAGPGSLFAAFAGERTDGHEHVPQAAERGAVAVLGTRATALPTVVVDDPQRALQVLASYVVAQVRAAGGLTVLALTGSQGKTSTKDLLAAVLAEWGPTVATHGSFNNELGMPLTSLRVEPGTRFLVLEMGARGRGHLTELTDLVPPDVSVVLNVGTAHLGEFGSRDAIAEAKGELVAAVRTDGVAVLNADDERVAAMTSLSPERVLTFGTSEDADVRLGDLVLDRLGRPSFTLTSGGARAEVSLRLVGAHQALNAAAAATAALAVGMPLEDAAAASAGSPPCRSGGWSSTSSRAASSCSTTPTTPTPSRCGPRSTRSSRSAPMTRSRAPSPCSARCASSARTARPPTAGSASTPPSGSTSCS